MKLRQEISPLRRRLSGAASTALVLVLWVLLTAPLLPPLPEEAAPAAPAGGGAQQVQPPAQPGEQPSKPGGFSGPEAPPAPGYVGPQPPSGSTDAAAAGGQALGLMGGDSGTAPGGEGNLQYWRSTRPEALGGRRPIISSMILPSPWQVLAALGYMHTNEGLVRSAIASFLRISVSFLLAVLVAIPLAVLMGSYPPIRAWFEPFTGPLRYLPISAVTGLFILLFGIGEEMKIAFLFVGSVVYLIPICTEAILNVEDIYLETALTLGARPRQVVMRVLWPAAWPSIFEACRVIYGVGWTYVILAELVNAKYGLGYLIAQSSKFGKVDQAYALVLVILALGVGTNEVFRQIGRRLFAWRAA
jgi:NitT/TauT family transport system permease protein